MGMDFRGQVRKWAWKNVMFESEIGSGFGGPGGTPLSRIVKSTP